MGYSKFTNGFLVGSASAIDQRLILSKAEMLVAEDTFWNALPPIYFCICTDDGKFYIYNKNNELDSTTGKYRVVDESINFVTDAAKAQLNAALQASTVITGIQSSVDTLTNSVNTLSGSVSTQQGTISTLQSTVGELSGDVSGLKTWVENVKLDGGEIKANYDLIGTILHVVPATTNPNTIPYMGNATLTFSEASGYSLPTTVKVDSVVLTNGADYVDCGGVKAKWLADTAGGRLYLQEAKKDIRYEVVA